MIHAKLGGPLPLWLEVFSATGFIDKRRQRSSFLRRSEQQILRLRRLKEPVDRRAHDRAAVGQVIGRPQSRTPLRGGGQHARAIGPHAEINREAAAELDGILRVERKQVRGVAAGKLERIVLVVLERALAQTGVFACLFVRDEKREVLVQAQTRGFDTGLQRLLAAVMRDARQHADAPQRAIGVQVQRDVVIAANECGRPRPMISGDLRHGIWPHHARCHDPVCQVWMFSCR